MTENIDNQFTNRLLNIKYNLAKNVVTDEENPGDLEIQICDKALLLWKRYIADNISRFPTEDFKKDIYYSNYKFDGWFEPGNVEYLLNFAETGEIENAREPLKLVLPKIGNEIFKFVELFCKLNFALSKETLTRFLNGLYLTPQGTIDYIRTATYLIENTDLRVKDKYGMACYLCLEEKIAEYVKEYRRTYGNLFIYNEPARLTVYWTFHLDGKDREFFEQIKRRLKAQDDLDEHLLFWAIRNGNEVAVHHIWEKIFANEFKDNVLEYVKYSLDYDSTNILCYMISQISKEDELKTLCLEEGNTILAKLLFNSRWRKFFRNAADYVYTFVNEMAFLIAIKTVIVLWLEDEFDKVSLRFLLDDMCVKFEVDIDYFVFESRTFLRILLCMSDEYIMKELLSIENVADFKSLFNRNTVISMGKELIACKMQHLFESFIREVLNADEIEPFKERFFNLTRSRI